MKSLKTLIVSLVILIIALIFIYLQLHLANYGRIIEKTKLCMGTIVRIKVPLQGIDARAARRAIGKAFDEIRRVENLFSVFKDDSEISRINKLGSEEPLKVSDEVFGLVEKSVEYSEKTKGAFDITVKPLVDLWKAAGKNRTLPADDEIGLAMDKVGSRYLTLDNANRTIAFKKGGMALDLGGVAKGYATDRAVRVLRACGIKNAIVGCGGDMYCLGRRAPGVLWKVGVQHPRDKNRVILRIRLENKAVDTSGDYERYFILNGKRYSHIIDPRTGYPIGDAVVSATVIAPDATTADILATSLCILGREGFETVESTADADAILVIKEGQRLKTEATKGVEARYDIEKKNAQK